MMKESAVTGTGNKSLRVLIAEDYQMMRQLIRSILTKEPDIEVIGEAMDGLEALELIKQLKPDVVIMDLAMPRLSGIQVMQQVQALGTQVLFVSVHNQPDLVQGALAAGAKGYLQKQSIYHELVAAVRAVSQGNTYFTQMGP